MVFSGEGGPKMVFLTTVIYRIPRFWRRSVLTCILNDLYLAGLSKRGFQTSYKVQNCPCTYGCFSIHILCTRTIREFLAAKVLPKFQVSKLASLKLYPQVQLLRARVNYQPSKSPSFQTLPRLYSSTSHCPQPHFPRFPPSLSG
jgi:hypothetical protein